MIYHQFNPRPELKFKREYIQAEDGGVFSLDWVVGPPKETKKLLVVLHGLLGGSEAGYLREILRGFLLTGEYKIVVVHNRGISDTPLFTPFCFHASYTSDLEFALNLIKKRLPNHFCCCLGTSLGANIFVKLLAQDHSLNDYIKCLISISNPLNIFEGEKRNRGGLICKFMKNNFVRYYNMHQILKSVDGKYNLLTILLGFIPKNLNFLFLGIDYKKFREIKDYHEIDSHFTLKIHKNFENLEDYYIKSSSCFDIHKLGIPTLFINSKDDIISPYDTVDYSHCKYKKINFEILFKKIFLNFLVYSNEKLMMILTDTGGHVTYYHGNLRPTRWFIKKSILYSEAIYEYYQEHKEKEITNGDYLNRVE
jgi:uncharacterized protein